MFTWWFSSMCFPRAAQVNKKTWGQKQQRSNGESVKKSLINKSKRERETERQRVREKERKRKRQ
jgi:hypothetical protein